MNNPSNLSGVTPEVSLPLARNRRGWYIAAILYAILVVYGSLYPLTGWTVPHDPLFSFLIVPLPEHDSRADLLTNVLAYIPLGLVLMWSLPARASALMISLATLAGTLLSFTMESVQMFLPSRTSSRIDLLTNIVGTFIGAVAGSLLHDNSKARFRLRGTRDVWFDHQTGANAALFAGLLWVLSQLSPFVPSMDVSSIREGLSPLWYSLHDVSSISLWKLITYALNIAGIGFLVSVVARSAMRVTILFVGLAGLVLCSKAFIVTRQVSLESLLGLGVAAIILIAVPRGRGVRALLAILCIFGGFISAELTPAPGGLHPFNWLPFAGQIDNTVSGFGSILEGIWPFAALGSVAILGFGRKRPLMFYAGTVLVALVFAFEWVQQGIAGRYGDITTVLLAAVGWTLPWFSVLITQEPQRSRVRAERRHPRTDSA